MAQSFFEIARDVGDVIGIKRVTSLVGNSEPHARAMLVLLDQGGKNLTKLRNTWGASWAVLTREHTFTTVAAQEEYAFPEDFTAFVDGTVWDRSSYREARGVFSPQEWQQVKSGLIETSGIAPNYRIRRGASGRGRSLYLDPIPGGGEILVYEYVSRSWVVDAAGTSFGERIAVDTDEPLFDDDLVRMDLVWRFKQSRGLSFATELAEFEIERDRRLAEDAGTRKLEVGRSSPFVDDLGVNIPATGFGSVTG